MLCSICGQDKQHMSRKTQPSLCHECYMKKYHETHQRKFDVCIKCNKMRRIETRDIKGNPICDKCYIPAHRECGKCRVVGEIEANYNGVPICRRCYKEPKHICFLCGKERVAASTDNNKFICKSCYQNKDICSMCKEYKTVYLRSELNEPVCNRCGHKKEICERCQRLRIIHKIDDGKRICHSCYMVWRYHHDPIFSMRQRLRAVFGAAIRSYTKEGKTKSSRKYGIDYDKIIEHLGKCPGNLSEYQIDHIMPLVAFDLNNPLHIKAAFAPENHRWCSATENHRKCAKFDQQELNTYLEKWGC